LQEREIEYRARKHGTTVEKVRAIIAQTISRSRREIDEALDQHSQHHATMVTRRTRSRFQGTAAA